MCQMPSTVIQTTVYKLPYYIEDKNQAECGWRCQQESTESDSCSKQFLGQQFFDGMLKYQVQLELKYTPLTQNCESGL